MAAQGRQVEYRNVKADAAWMAEMLRHSNGAREVPVIVDGDVVTIGWGGQA